LYCDDVPVDTDVVDPVLVVEKPYVFESVLRFELCFLITRRNLRSVVDILSLDSTCGAIFFVNRDGSEFEGGLCCNFVTAVIVRSTGVMGFGRAEGRRSLLVYIEVSISDESALADLDIADRPNGAFGAARPADTCRGVVPADVDRSLFDEGLGRSLGADAPSPTEMFRTLVFMLLFAMTEWLKMLVKMPGDSTEHHHTRSTHRTRRRFKAMKITFGFLCHISCYFDGIG
jgi:hypothetical protein